MARVVKIDSRFTVESSKDFSLYFKEGGRFYKHSDITGWRMVDGRTVPKDAKRLLNAGA